MVEDVVGVPLFLHPLEPRIVVLVVEVLPVHQAGIAIIDITAVDHVVRPRTARAVWYWSLRIEERCGTAVALG
jgi:hypothetical protein